MPRANIVVTVVLAGLGLFSAAQAGSLPVDALPLPNRIATADIVVAGKVTSFEDKLVSAARFPGAKDKVDFKIAVITVSDPLRVAKGTKTVRVGFVPLQPGVFVSPPPFQPAVGLEGCFFLTRHADGDFYTASRQLNVVNKNSPNFAKDLATITRCTKLLEDPNASLKAENAEDRFLTAAMLLAQYRTRRTSKDKTEPIDAAQSKLILQAIAGADWTPSNDFTKLSPRMALLKLPLTKKDGWTPPPFQDAKAYSAYAQQWLRDHAETYRIERFIVEKVQ
jgi:hypothetical protein